MEAIAVENLTKQYHNGVQALNGSLPDSRGRGNLFLLGQNGSSKSTFDQYPDHLSFAHLWQSGALWKGRGHRSICDTAANSLRGAEDFHRPLLVLTGKHAVSKPSAQDT